MMLSWLFSDPLPVGAAAPDFSLRDDSGRTVSLSALRGRNVVLVFYPGDDTPGCTKQLCQFRDDWSQATARGVEVFGVNPQSARQPRAISAKKFQFPFPLLVDERQKVAEAVPRQRADCEAHSLPDRPRRQDSLRSARHAGSRRSVRSSEIIPRRPA